MLDIIKINVDMFSVQGINYFPLVLCWAVLNQAGHGFLWAFVFRIGVTHFFDPYLDLHYSLGKELSHNVRRWRPTLTSIKCPGKQRRMQAFALYTWEWGSFRGAEQLVNYRLHHKAEWKRRARLRMVWWVWERHCGKICVSRRQKSLNERKGKYPLEAQE